MAAKNINGKEFQELALQDQLVLVDYWAPWCGYCRRIGPLYERMADQYQGDVELVKINIDEEPQLAQQERIDVIPTLVLYRSGKELARVVAPQSKGEIESFIENNRDR